MAMLILTPFQATSVLNGKTQKQYHGAFRHPISVSFGTSKIAPFPFLIRKSRNILQPSKNGSPTPHTPFLRYKNYTENCYPQPWWYQKDEHTSPTWRPCLAPLTVLSYLTPHPETLNAILNGGNNSFNPPPSYDLYQSLQQSWTSMHTPTPALESASLSQLGTDGVPGYLPQVGNLKEGTSDGRRPWDSNSSPGSSSAKQQQEPISRSMETTWGLLKDGGRGGAGTDKPTRSSIVYTSCQESTIALYTCDMSQVQKTQQTSLLMESTPIHLLLPRIPIPKEIVEIVKYVTDLHQ